MQLTTVVLAHGCISSAHAGQFKAFVKQVRNQYGLTKILKSEIRWPSNPEDRDVLYFLAQSFSAHLLKELPNDDKTLSDNHRQLAHVAKNLLKELSSISLEIAQMVVGKGEDGVNLPDWFLVSIIRDLPRLAQVRK